MLALTWHVHHCFYNDNSVAKRTVIALCFYLWWTRLHQSWTPHMVLPLCNLNLLLLMTPLTFSTVCLKCCDQELVTESYLQSSARQAQNVVSKLFDGESSDSVRWRQTVLPPHAPLLLLLLLLTHSSSHPSFLLSSFKSGYAFCCCCHSKKDTNPNDNRDRTGLSRLVCTGLYCPGRIHESDWSSTAREKLQVPDEWTQLYLVALLSDQTQLVWLSRCCSIQHTHTHTHKHTHTSDLTKLTWFSPSSEMWTCPTSKVQESKS